MEIIPIIVGFLFSAIGGYILFDTYNFRKISQLVMGELVGYESHVSKSRKSGSTTMYAPVVEFSDSGEVFRFKGKISSGRMSYKVGESVPVLYMGNDPHNARIRTNLRYMFGGVFAFIGVIALVIGIVNFRSDKLSLIIAAIVIGFFIFKILKVKSRFNAKGIRTVADFKNRSKTKTGDPLLDGLATHNASEARDKNYRPSENLITSQADVNKRQQIPKWVPSLVIVIGLGLLTGGAYLGQKRATFLDIAETTQGQVVSMESSASDGSTVYYPIVRYIFPINNQSVRFKHSVGSSHPGWRTGDTVAVLYNPADKKEAMIDDGWMNWLGPGILVGMGVIFFLIGLSTSRLRKRSLNQ